MDKDNKTIVRLTLKLKNGEVIVKEGYEIFFQVESIQIQLANNQDIICFGYVGVDRELIEYFYFEEIKYNKIDFKDEIRVQNVNLPIGTKLVRHECQCDKRIESKSVVNIHNAYVSADLNIQELTEEFLKRNFKKISSL